MKKTMLTSGISLIITIMLISCGNNTQSQSVKDAIDLKDGIQKMMPGGIATTANGYTMTAKINGKDWSATSMMPPGVAGRIVGDNNGESISLPYYDRRNLLALPKRKLGEGHDGVDLFLNDDVKIWGAKSGVMEITKVDDNWIEGTFSFIATGLQSDKTTEVTDGFFRIAFAQKK
jgi:hypothetical protein